MNYSCMRILPIMFALGLGLNTLVSQNKTNNIEKQPCDITKLDNLFFEPKITTPEDGTVIAYSYLHPDLLSFYNTER